MKKMDRRKAIKNLGIGLGSIPFMSHALTDSDTATPNVNTITAKDYAKADIDKPITVITLGAGSRGNTYGNYGLKFPEQLDIVGVAEPIQIRNERYAEKHNIPDEHRFDTWEHVFERPKFADAVIISTPDDLHYAPCMKALEMGYDILLEKPIAPTEKECRDILELAKKPVESWQFAMYCAMRLISLN